MLKLVEDEDLQQAAQWELEGDTNDEIAGKMGYSRRTVQRMLTLIRAVWSREIEGAEGGNGTWGIDRAQVATKASGRLGKPAPRS